MKIVFMGTPEFAEASLQKLLETDHQIVGVFTQPDKPKGRGYKLVAPPVKELALAHNIPVFQPQKMRDGTALDILQELQPDLIAVVAYGKILPKEILELPRYGCINVHGSLLPKYRGAGPIQWSVINGESVTGVTTMYMGEGLDTGDMILKKETPIGENETYGELHDRLKEIGAQALVETIELIEQGKAPREVQDNSLSSYAPMLDKQIARLDFTKDAQTLHNLIRGLSPWPVAHTTVDGKLLKVHRAVLASGKGQPGEVVDSKKFIVACKEGALELLEVQLEGGKRMKGEDFLRGRKPKKLGE
ncbi:methionyl-tRNA formyltransferase [uncultured Negativibacillus sp.]|uniref:methionyl-tRNA formyltransferase n=1 Tax=uncultured Negativibacillus sp. TaxID=1980696 RepID=UPI0025E74962|nr:methionyl-tRNA formyltransferase [uncultured Negativibacillus sp.]